jgi:ribonuclease HII
LVNENKNSLFFFEKRVVCGIDEAGRGPIAGPLVVAGVVLNSEIDGLNDSKKLSAKKREVLFKEIISNSKYHIVVIKADKIDEIGLSKSLKMALLEIKSHFLDDEVEFIFDGNSSFGVDGVNTLIKADQKIAQVAAASILAKVTRDRLMIDYSKLYPEYNFDRHKGYCTKAHLDAVAKYGLCPIHRKSFNIPLPINTKGLFE